MDASFATSTPTGPVLGGWFTPVAGPFVGRCIRVSLEEVQKADVGRRYGFKDKRALDPPPVARLRIFELLHSGTPQQVEKEVEFHDNLTTYGFICYVDLFTTAANTTTRSLEARPSVQQSKLQPAVELPTGQNTSFPASSSLSHSPHGFTRNSPPRSLPVDSRSSSMMFSQHMGTSKGTRTPTASKFSFMCTQHLAGERFAQCSLTDYEGTKRAMFIFSDIAVRNEGRFELRYRVFDIYNQSFPDVRSSCPVLAECRGGSFEVFSTKAFPGLRPSTNLTMHLMRSGFRLNARRHERKSTKRVHSASSSTSNHSYHNDYSTEPEHDSDVPSSSGTSSTLSSCALWPNSPLSALGGSSTASSSSTACNQHAVPAVAPTRFSLPPLLPASSGPALPPALVSWFESQGGISGFDFGGPPPSGWQDTT